jgi:uncharacterized protein (TIGR02246 family)
MKTSLAVGACLMPILLGACTPRFDESKDVQAIKESCIEWDRAWNAGDAHAVAALYANGAVVMPPNKPAGLAREHVRAYEKYFAEFREENRTTVDDVRVSGNLGVARGRQETLTFPNNGGQPSKDKAKWMTVFQRQGDGSWKILWEIYNSDLPAGDSSSQ